MKTPRETYITVNEMIMNFRNKFPKAKIKFVIDPKLLEGDNK